jgi:hypothetical protein
MNSETLQSNKSALSLWKIIRGNFTGLREWKQKNDGIKHSVFYSFIVF